MPTPLTPQPDSMGAGRVQRDEKAQGRHSDSPDVVLAARKAPRQGSEGHSGTLTEEAKNR